VDKFLTTIRDVSCHEKPVDKLVSGNGTTFRDKVVHVRRLSIDDTSTPSASDAYFIHEGIVAGLLFHQQYVIRTGGQR